MRLIALCALLLCLSSCRPREEAVVLFSNLNEADLVGMRDFLAKNKGQYWLNHNELRVLPSNRRTMLAEIIAVGAAPKSVHLCSVFRPYSLNECEPTPAEVNEIVSAVFSLMQEIKEFKLETNSEYLFQTTRDHTDLNLRVAFNGSEQGTKLSQQIVFLRRILPIGKVIINGKEVSVN